MPDTKQDINTAISHIHSRDSQALSMLTQHPEHPKRIHWKKILVRIAIILVTLALAQIPAIAEIFTGIGSLLVPETELGGIGIALILAWRLGPHIDHWLGIDDR
jgi:hypothetical protein